MSDDGRYALVLIAFIGSVFSPYYFQARKCGAGDPHEHCASNIALYGAGFGRWSFTEYGRRALRVGPDRLELGRTSLSQLGSTLTWSFDECCVPWPSRVRGKVTIHGYEISAPELSLTPDGVHVWRALVPHGRVQVELERPALRWQGTGYLDSNRGGAPLDEGFRHWSWLRAHTRQGAIVVYSVIPARAPPMTHALIFPASGAPRNFAPPPRVALPMSRWRVARDVPADAAAVPTVLRTLEDAPFYARSVVTTHLGGEPLTAMHESLSLTRFQSAWVRSLLPFRMRRSRR
jgi:carotenoid 1,2-hydratase